MRASLLATKLNRPQTTTDLISRPRLFERLERGSKRKLTLIAAPAGYGKSTLAVSWLETCSRPAAWLSLEEQDNDLDLFLAYIVGAIQSLFPNACSQTFNLLQAPQDVPPEHLATSLINEIAALPETFILVLDDYQFISQESIHHFMDRLVSQMPALVQLVIISRETPPLRIPRLRANREIQEIRLKDLRFSPAEGGDFLAQFLGTPAPADIVEMLIDRTEGWIVGLQLAAFSMRDQTDYRPFVETLRGTNRYIMEYLVDEIIMRQPEDIRDFLLKTSILDRFCGPLCDAVTGNNDLVRNGQAYLEQLQRANFLMVPLDEKNRWYRHHHLFKDLLYYKLTEETDHQEISALHAKAADWLADNDLLEQALYHLLAADDTLGAAQLVENNRQHLLDQDDWRTLERWLTLLPTDLLQERPGLLMARALILLFTLRVQGIPPLVQTAETLLKEPSLRLTPDEASLIGAEVAVVKGTLEYWQGQGQLSFDYLQRAIPQIAPEHSYLRGTTMIYFCLAMQMNGQQEMALQTAANALQEDAASDSILTVRLLAGEFFVYLIAGELPKFVQRAEHGLRICEHLNFVHLGAWCHYLLGYAHYLWNDLETAEIHLMRAVENRYQLNTRAAFDSLTLLGLTYQAMQQPAKTGETVEMLLNFGTQCENQACMAIAHSCRARISLQQDDPEATTRWLQTADISADVGALSLWMQTPRLTYCRALITKGTATALQEAVEKLQAHLKTAEDSHNTLHIIEILILQSMARQAQTQVDEALAALKRAVVLAQPGGFIRSFVDCGPPMAGLLRQLADQGVAPDYICQILAAFPNIEFQVDNLQLENKEIVSRKPVLSETDVSKTETLIEPFTNREREILDLLAAGLSNQEIAQSLCISIPTVKSHITHILQKLGVKNRYQAVAKAKTLNLLSADNGRSDR